MAKSTEEAAPKQPKKSKKNERTWDDNVALVCLIVINYTLVGWAVQMGADKYLIDSVPRYIPFGLAAIVVSFMIYLTNKIANKQ